MSIVKYLENRALTANGLLAYNSTENCFLDMFGQISSMRYSDSKDIIELFDKCYQTDKLLALKLVFYIRAFRGLGQGERKVARVLYKYLAKNYPEVFLKNMELIPYYGRYDDLYALVDTPLEEECFKFMYDTISADLVNEYPTLLAKWLISPNLKSNKANLGVRTAKYFAYFKTEDKSYLSNSIDNHKFNLLCKEYRLILSKLRAKIDIIERKLCQKDYDNIDFSKIPSRALLQYSNFFNTKLSASFTKYLEDVKNNFAKINIKALTPYDIVAKTLIKPSEAYEQMWNNLPDYVNGEFNILVVADTSGSMMGKPMAVALSLAVYFASHNQGIWHNKMITFSRIPQFVTIKGNTLAEKLKNIPEIVDNTNIEAVFNLILKTAIAHDLASKELPEKIIIISDMQFDECDMSEKDYYNHIKGKYEAYGYNLPDIIFWNVSMADYRGKFHITYNDDGALLVSGLNPNIFESIIRQEDLNPLKYMLSVLNDEYFSLVKI